MSLKEDTVIDKVETNRATGVISVRTATIIYKDGKEISRSNHRRLLTPGMDISSEPADIQAQCAALWTPELVAEYQANIANAGG